MPDDTVTSSWKRFTDKVNGLRGEPADDHCVDVSAAPFLQDTDGAHCAPGSSALRLAELRFRVRHLLLAWPGAYKGDDSVTIDKGHFRRRRNGHELNSVPNLQAGIRSVCVVRLPRLRDRPTAFASAPRRLIP